MGTLGTSYYSQDLDDGVNTIEVKKGSPLKARYAIFYMVKKDPVIFCTTWDKTVSEVYKLRKRKDVKEKSIRVFKLMAIN